ncbi:MAG: exonuclease SbcCD subunit D [Armatimonadota bacterium]
MTMIRLLHTADIHLDAPNQALGERAADLRRAVRDAFTRVVDAALQQQAQLLVVAGDLFDSAAPDGATVEFALAQLARLAHAAPPIHVALLPGTHDCWAEGGLWETPRIRALPDCVHVLAGPAPRTVLLPHLDLALHGCAHRCRRGGQRPLCELRASDEAAVNVAVAHGSLERGDVADDSMFTAAEISATGMDYVALGHWHGWQEHSVGGITAINPGSPEVTGFGQRDEGAVALVTLGDGAVRVERLRVGALRASQLTIDAADLVSAADLAARVAEHADPHLLLELTLTGLAPSGVVVDVEALREQLAGSFYVLRIHDASHPTLDDLDEAVLDERLALGRFVALARERIAAAADERERRVAERALQIGVSMLADATGRRGEGDAR